MWNNFRNPKFYLMLAADLVAFAASLYAAYLVRFDFSLNPYHQEQFLEMLKYVLSIKVAVFFGLGLYKGMWRYTSLGDFWKILEATFLQSVILITIILYKFGFTGFSRGVFLIDWVLTFILTGGVRILIRSAYALKDSSALHRPVERKRVLIIGAGRAGERIVRELKEDSSYPYVVVGFVDKDRAKRGRTLHNIPVLGGLEELDRLIEKYRVQEIFIAVTEAPAEEMRSLVQACKQSAVTHKILPSMGEIMEGKAALSALREVNYRDLLGRAAVDLDTSAIGAYLTGKRVLVTGCGGSIGSELVRQLVRFSPAGLILVDAGEANLYAIQMELEHELKYRDYATVLGSVQNADLMERTFAEHRPHCVFHAAAYKHVPMIERNPWQAVSNNIVGTRTAMETAVRHQVERFVVVSTDKAVRPTNVMGASKRVTELLMRCFEGGATQFMAVRFGNVLGSSGSVVPLFKRQIERGGPVTVTHPEVTRYFMSISEAAQLILQAGAMAKGGEIFVLEMGRPVRIADMARDLIRLSGKEPGVDVDIVFTGLREGEKLYEELITEGENVIRTEHDKIMVLAEPGGAADREEQVRELERDIFELVAAARRFDPDGVRSFLRSIVPEYKTPEKK